MFLKNTSNTASISIRTVKGKIGLKPQEVVNINVKLLHPVPTSLAAVKEEDFLAYMESKNSLINGIIIEQELKQKMQLNEDEQQKQTPEQTIVQPVIQPEEPNNKIPKIELAPTTNIDIVNELIQSNLLDGEKPEEVVEVAVQQQKTDKTEEKSPSLVVENMEIGSDVQKLKQQIESLQQTWLSTRGAKKKEKLQKQIMELKKQLSKLEK